MGNSNFGTLDMCELNCFTDDAISELQGMGFVSSDLDNFHDIFLNITCESQALSWGDIVVFFGIDRNDCMQHVVSKLCDADESDRYLGVREFVLIIWHIQTIGFNMGR